MDFFTGVLIGYMIKTFQKELILGIKEGLEWISNTGKYKKVS